MHDNATMKKIAVTIGVLTALVISFMMGRHMAFAEAGPEITQSAVNLIYAEGQLDICREIINGLNSDGKIFVINTEGE